MASQRKSQKNIEFLLKAGVLISTAYAMVCMWHWKIGLTYFTELSNLFAAGVVLAQLLAGRRKPSAGLKMLSMLKYAATVSVIVTFLIFLFVLAPVMPGGILAAYRQDHYASLCLHVITPVLTTLDFLFHDGDHPWRLKQVFFCIVPPICYFIFILVLGASGVRWKGMSAPYPFLNYSAPAGWFGFMPETAGIFTLGIGVFYAMIVLLALLLLLGWLLLLIMKKLHPEQQAAYSSTSLQ